MDKEISARKKRNRSRKRREYFYLIVLLIVFIASLALGLALRSSLKPESNPALQAKLQLTLKIDGELKKLVVPLADSFYKDNELVEVSYGDDSYNVAVEANPSFEEFQSEILEIPPLTLKAGSYERTLRPSKAFYISGSAPSEIMEELANYLKENLPGKIPNWTINVAGDIIPGRHVAEKMAQKGVLYPFQNVAPYTQGADIVFADLECPLSDRFKPPYSGTTFLAPTSTIQGIKLLGINVVALANNHSTNFGAGPFLDTINLLDANQIKHVGGGRNSAEAYAPLFMEVKGIKIAFLNYNAILGSVNATESRAGTTWVDLPPWAKDNPQHVKMVQDAVSGAKKQADLVIVSFHWSEEYKYYPNSSMVNMAHASIDAGADMVIGSHPHCIQGIEYYKNGFIAYSLGNFIFDQMWAEYTRLGFIAKMKLQHHWLIEIQLLPYQIVDYCQPNVYQGNSGQFLLDRLFQISGLK